MEPIQNYPVPEPVGLFAAVMKAGHSVWTQDGVRYASDAVAVQTIIDAYSVEHAKLEKCAQVLAHAKSLRDAAIASVSAGEMASWAIKRAEAEAFARDGEQAACPMLRAEAAYRGIGLADLVEKVNVNSLRFSMLEAAIGGSDGRHRDAIKNLTSFADVNAYDFSVGWPDF